MTDPLIPTVINGKWKLDLPAHRAAREQWGDWYDDSGLPHFGWEVERLDSMHRNIGPGDIVYDIGTEEGDLSALYATWIGPTDGGICLFEPNHRVWSNIRAIFEGNAVRQPLSFWHGFAGDENRNLDIAEDWTTWPESSNGPLISDHGFSNLCEREDLPSIQLDDFATMTGFIPTIITIDVEGAEYSVLFGAHEILTNHFPLVYVSIHPNFMRDMYSLEPQAVHDYMSEHGYREKLLAIDHEEHWAFYNPYGRELRF